MLALSGAVRIEGREPLLQAVHGRPPPLPRGLKHGILVAEPADLMKRPFPRKFRSQRIGPKVENAA